MRELTRDEKKTLLIVNGIGALKGYKNITEEEFIEYLSKDSIFSMALVEDITKIPNELYVAMEDIVDSCAM